MTCSRSDHGVAANQGGGRSHRQASPASSPVRTTHARCPSAPSPRASAGSETERRGCTPGRSTEDQSHHNFRTKRSHPPARRSRINCCGRESATPRCCWCTTRVDVLWPTEFLVEGYQDMGGGRFIDRGDLRESPRYLTSRGVWVASYTGVDGGDPHVRVVPVRIIEYNSEAGVSTWWNDDAYLRAEVESSPEPTVVISGNPAGLVSLARHLICLAQSGVPDGSHFNFDTYCGALADDSRGFRLEVEK